MSNGKSLIKPRWKPGESGNPKGRPKKTLNHLKDLGYRKQEVIDTMEVMLAMTIEDLRHILADNGSTILQRTVAASLVKALPKGDLFAIETIMNRTYGRPTETLDSNVNFVKPLIIDWGEGEDAPGDPADAETTGGVPGMQDE